ncbi:MAG TPA: hypothetical protein VLF19_00300, partial [Methylomirabilota bacterium]|nr:hypothetical protein [Methylomirabilota bacterium]
THRADNTRLRELGVARVFRHESAEGTEPKPAMLSRGRIVGYTEIGTIPLMPGVAPGPPARPGGQVAVVDGTRVTFQDRQAITHGRRYSYVVVTEDLQGRTSPPSPRVSVVFVAPPEAPGQLAATPGEGQVRLTWTPPSRLADGSPAEGPIFYEVLRAPDATAPLTPVTPAPIEATEIVDRNLENERTYHYAVRALRRQGETTSRGPATERIAATPADMTPPPAPSGLVAAVAGGTVRLSWLPSPASDVARYVIYRAPPGAPFTRVGTVAAPATVFVDRDVPAGTHRYAVTAQDTGSRANEGPRSSEATVTLP